MPRVNDMNDAKALALAEFKKRYPYGLKVDMTAQRMSEVWIVRIRWGSPPKESEYRVDGPTGQVWRIS